MYAVEVTNVSKSFAVKVVDRVSFNVASGEILGMVGPNGAGKTTTIRMLMDILRPDEGCIKVLGQPLNDETKNRIGYLPEERGMYRKARVSECLTYLAALKGVPQAVARDRMQTLLQRVNMLPHKDKKVEELSRGMGQIMQFVSTILHEPALLILDEPFSGLDPVNTELLKELILELRGQGRTIILSTHIMGQVEELCDRVVMINKGKAVLNGRLDEIKARYRDNTVLLKAQPYIYELPGVEQIREGGQFLELVLGPRTTPQEVLNNLVRLGIEVEHFEVATPTLHDIFIRTVKEAS